MRMHFFSQAKKPKDRRLGIMVVKRYGDWHYVDIYWWWGGVMINLWEVKE